MATHLLSTLHVAPGQVLALAVDLNGQWHADTPYWKAFEQVPAELLRRKLEVLPTLAEAGLLQDGQGHQQCWPARYAADAPGTNRLRRRDRS
ncbi:hypothetical protein UMZ34_00535 [Halopseudomonas pachastrellae]|nr:hypothetical protein UMZ34_00535 [Halopseudomonas pachastrellae]